MLVEIKFRPIVSQDFSIVHDIHLESTPTSWNDEALKAEIEHKHWGSRLALNGDMAVGFLLARGVGEDCEISSMAVRLNFRRHGVGKSLILDLISDARKRHRSSRILLEVKHDNIAALELYRSMGFVPGRLRKSYYSDGSDALEMSLSL